MLLAVAGKLGPLLDQLPQQPVRRTEGSRKLARSLREELPRSGEPFRRLLARLVDRVIPIGLNTASPGYLGFIPGGGLPHAAVADLVSGLANRFTGLWLPAPGLVQLEMDVIRWLCELVGFTDPSAGGVLCSGGSLANLGAVVAARHSVSDDEGDFSNARIYTSRQAHHSVAKALRVAGFRPDQLVVIEVDDRYRLPVEALAEAVRADRAAGLRPALVVASAGTTATGAVDPLDALADLCAHEDLWLHVDGAYGGCFALTERGQTVLHGLARADSITLDPHKGFFLPYGTGALLVRDRARLSAAFRVEAGYLPPPVQTDEAWDFADLGPELSRPYRGLRLWLPLKMHGVGAFADALDEKLDLAREAADRIAALPGVRMVTRPELSLFAFRVTVDHLDQAERDAHFLDGLNKRIIARVNDRGRVLLTGATVLLDGAPAFVIRVCVLSFRTHRDRIHALVEDLGAAISDPRG